MTTMWPESPDPAAVGAVSSAVALHAASRRVQLLTFGHPTDLA
ncbi:MAG: hypothetical protein JWN70_1846 [Planctomycetaceae bacterium]|nr:hypothetical protein [Planctomycetaceae bacterium]